MGVKGNGTAPLHLRHGRQLGAPGAAVRVCPLKETFQQPLPKALDIPKGVDVALEAVAQRGTQWPGGCLDFMNEGSSQTSVVLWLHGREREPRRKTPGVPLPGVLREQQGCWEGLSAGMLLHSSPSAPSGCSWAAPVPHLQPVSGSVIQVMFSTKSFFFSLKNSKSFKFKVSCTRSTTVNCLT